MGYCHFHKQGEVYLGGGMCIDSRAYRRLPADSRREIRRGGGIAYQVLKYAVGQLDDCAAVFGYVGDRRAESVDLKVGFRHTGVPHLIVMWKRKLDERRKQEIIREIAEVGPF